MATYSTPIIAKTAIVDLFIAEDFSSCSIHKVTTFSPNIQNNLVALFFPLSSVFSQPLRCQA